MQVYPLYKLIIYYPRTYPPAIHPPVRDRERFGVGVGVVEALSVGLHWSRIVRAGIRFTGFSAVVFRGRGCLCEGGRVLPSVLPGAEGGGWRGEGLVWGLFRTGASGLGWYFSWSCMRFEWGDGARTMGRWDRRGYGDGDGE